MRLLQLTIAALVASLAALTSPVLAGDDPPSPPNAETGAVQPGPADIVNAASQDEWVMIGPEDMLVMTLAPDAAGKERKVVIQLIPAPFSQGWISNIRTLARAKWYDGVSVNRVQDNYVVQWGDPGHDNPESGDLEAKPLPEGLKVMGEEDYSILLSKAPIISQSAETFFVDFREQLGLVLKGIAPLRRDAYADWALPAMGWPVAIGQGRVWPVHCYAMVGVGRGYSPDTGSGAELYTVIGHAPRHLDRNIALVGRIIWGMKHLSSLPRGSGALGFYTKEEADKRTPILSIRVASDLPEAERPHFAYLSTESESFRRYVRARANRRDPFFIHAAGGADVCNIPVPVIPVPVQYIEDTDE